jgi:hypothetical protein
VADSKVECLDKESKADERKERKKSYSAAIAQLPHVTACS